MTRWQLFWRNVWLSVRLAPSDPRALDFLLRVAGVALYLFAYTALLIRNYRETGLGGVIGYFVLLLPALAVAWGIRRSHRRDDQNVGLGLVSYNSPSPEQDYEAHRRCLCEELLRVATLVERATGEQAVHLNLLAAEQVAASRQRTLLLARQPSLWTAYTAAEQQWLIDAPGSWPAGIAEQYATYAEAIRVLRWVLKLDQVLVPFEFATFDLGPTLALVRDPELANGSTCRRPWDLRPAQTAAQTMLTRLAAEASLRGLIHVPEDEGRAALHELADKARQASGEDLLLGAQTVSGITAERLQSAALLAQRRLDILTRTIDYLNGPADAPFSARPIPE